MATKKAAQRQREALGLRSAAEQVQHLNDEISKVEQKLQPHLDRADEIQVEIDRLKQEQLDIAQERRALEELELIPLRRELSTASIALGGRRLSDNPAE